MPEYGIENVMQEPVSLTFKEGREFGWTFEVLQPISITKLGFFNGQTVELMRSIKLYKGMNTLFHQDVTVGPDTIGFEDIKEELTLSEGTYIITVRSPHGTPAYYAESANVEFANIGIKYVSGTYQNINDVGWMYTPNCYLVSFEFELI